MKRFTREASSALEGRERILRTFSRRQALGLLGGSLAGLTLLSPAKSQAVPPPPPFRDRDHISLECLSQEPGPYRFLAGYPERGLSPGHSPNGDGVILVKNNRPEGPGVTGAYGNRTRWEAVKVLSNQSYPPHTYWFYFRGKWPPPPGAPYYEPGNRWLDGRVSDNTVGLAPTRSAPYTGTKWAVTWYGGDKISLLCLAGSGYPHLGGRTSPQSPLWPQDSNWGTVDLVPRDSNEYATNSTLWKVIILPK